MCIENLFLRPRSNARYLSGTSNVAGQVISCNRSHSAKKNVIFLKTNTVGKYESLQVPKEAESAKVIKNSFFFFHISTFFFLMFR